MQVKIIKTGGDESFFEQRINSFIKDKKVIDIKYQADLYSAYKSHSAMILYEEIDKSE